MEPIEVIIASETSGQLWNSSVWDPSSGTSLMSYRGGGVAAPRTLGLVGEDYIACAERTKPLLHIWPLNSQERVQGLRLVLPGVANCAAFSPDGLYCVIGIDEKLYVWQLGSGCLLAILSGHYQPLTQIKFCDDGSHFASAGADGFVLVWNLANVVADPGTDAASSSNARPLYTFTDHTLPVKDLHVGKGGLRTRMFTASADRSCKIYDLSTGEMLLSLVFEKSLTAVAVDSLEMNVFVGTVAGEIYQYSTCNPPRTREYYLTDKDRPPSFLGHTEAITCLSCSLDGETLISGSNDSSLIVWHVPSRQKTHMIPHRGPVTNAFFTVVPKNMFSDNFNPAVVLHGLQRNKEVQDDIEVYNTDALNFWESCKGFGDIANYSQVEDSSVQDVGKVKEEIKRLKQINSNLYNFAVDNLFKEIE